MFDDCQACEFVRGVAAKLVDYLLCPPNSSQEKLICHAVATYSVPLFYRDFYSFDLLFVTVLALSNGLLACEMLKCCCKCA